MPRSSRTAERHPGVQTASKRPLNVLVVDTEPQAGRLLTQFAAEQSLRVLPAANLAEARALLAQGPVDLALIDPDLPDGSGIALAQELARSRRDTQTILLANQLNLQHAIQAIRAGVGDIMVKPLDQRETVERIRQAIARRTLCRREQQQLRRLRRLCKKLNQARLEVSQQVDMLCSDLVTAYQELATQMQQVAQTSEFGMMIRHELDLEPVLQKTLEYLLQKAGPTNAALFLPANADEYTLGGYVNYDCSADSADMLLQHLADVVAPRIAKQAQPLHLANNEQITQWIGDDWAYLADCQVLAVACRHKQETLAILVLFRDASEPFSPDLVQLCSTISPMVADHLAKIIRIHHRHLPDFDEGDTQPQD